MTAKKKFLPIPKSFINDEEYIKSLIAFTSRSFFRKLVGEIHVLDLFLGASSLYEQVIPKEWRTCFDSLEMDDILELVLRHPLENDASHKLGLVPGSLVDFIQDVRNHELIRDVDEKMKHKQSKSDKMNRSVVCGMSKKKAHEVQHFTCYVSGLLSEIESPHNDASAKHNISHLADFGAGVAYLSRVLASEPYNRDIVAIESKKSNIEAGKLLDIRVKLLVPEDTTFPGSRKGLKHVKVPEKGSIQYVEKVLRDGDLDDVLESIKLEVELSRCAPKEHNELDSEEQDDTGSQQSGSSYKDNNRMEQSDPTLMIISLHSCGNLIHYALRALLQNNTVKAVAIIGCCYNLMSERFGPTYKPPYHHHSLDDLPSLNHADPNGFPMSQKFRNEEITFNITARMMACQAPHNWTSETSSSFFTRHFYRALLQRIFLDKGVLGATECERNKANGNGNVNDNDGENGENDSGEGGGPIIIGSLRKNSYISFFAYVTGAVEKILRSEHTADTIKERIKHVGLHTISKEEVHEYETRYQAGKKEISIMWTLMAFCAGCVESMILVDRYLFLEESDEVREVRVEAAFEYGISPRNMVVVGIK